MQTVIAIRDRDRFGKVAQSEPQSVCDLMVKIAAFQAVHSSSILGGRIDPNFCAAIEQLQAICE